MILVWFERSRGDEFDSGNNFQVEKKFLFQIDLEDWSILIVI